VLLSAGTPRTHRIRSSSRPGEAHQPRGRAPSADLVRLPSGCDTLGFSVGRFLVPPAAFLCGMDAMLDDGSRGGRVGEFRDVVAAPEVKPEKPAEGLGVSRQTVNARQRLALRQVRVALSGEIKFGTGETTVCWSQALARLSPHHWCSPAMCPLEGAVARVTIPYEIDGETHTEEPKVHITVVQRPLAPQQQSGQDSPGFERPNTGLLPRGSWRALSSRQSGICGASSAPRPLLDCCC
jgi:hypothetical protein